MTIKHRSSSDAATNTLGKRIPTQQQAPCTTSHQHLLGDGNRLSKHLHRLDLESLLQPKRRQLHHLVDLQRQDDKHVSSFVAVTSQYLPTYHLRTLRTSRHKYHGEAKSYASLLMLRIPYAQHGFDRTEVAMDSIRQRLLWTSLTFTSPVRTVPVRMVPCPRTEKQWSNAKYRGAEARLQGILARRDNSSATAPTPIVAVSSPQHVVGPPFPGSTTSSPPLTPTPASLSWPDPDPDPSPMPFSLPDRAVFLVFLPLDFCEEA